jgi:hypothetical protein
MVGTFHHCQRSDKLDSRAIAGDDSAAILEDLHAGLRYYGGSSLPGRSTEGLAARREPWYSADRRLVVCLGLPTISRYWPSAGSNGVCCVSVRMPTCCLWLEVDFWRQAAELESVARSPSQVGCPTSKRRSRGAWNGSRPKLSETEGSGKLLNFMAVGLPAVAFDTPVAQYLGPDGCSLLRDE